MNREETILKNIIGPTILHIGCAGHQVTPESPYWLHEQLNKHFPDLFGIDISQENLDRMRQLGYKNLSCQSAEDFQFDFRFDTIIAGELIEHLSNPGLLLNQCRYNLKPGGRLIVTTPNPFSLLSNWYALLKFPRTCQNPEHTNWFCVETLSNLASRYHFKMIEFILVKNYKMDDPSWKYRLFAQCILWLSPVLPKLWHSNTFVFILEAEATE